MIVENADPNSRVVVVTDETFEKEVVEASKTMPVFVDFWAQWCTPCLVFAPIVDKVAKEMGDKVKFAKIDVDANPKTSEAHGVMAIPNLVIFANGTKVVQQPGLLPEAAFKQLLQEQVDKMTIK